MSLLLASLGSFPGTASAATAGSQLWAERYDGPAKGSDSAAALGVSPDGSTVFATGKSEGSTSTYDYATAAYDASQWNQAVGEALRRYRE